MSTVIDLSNFEPRARNALLMSLFEGLKDNASFEFTNDQDPNELFQDIEALKLSNLRWEFSEQSADAWRIKIVKSTAKPNDEMREKTGCCGLCGGHN